MARPWAETWPRMASTRMPLVSLPCAPRGNLPVGIPQRNKGWQLSSVAFRRSGYCGVVEERGDGRRGKCDNENPKESAIFYVNLATAKRVPCCAAFSFIELLAVTYLRCAVSACVCVCESVYGVYPNRHNAIRLNRHLLNTSFTSCYVRFGKENNWLQPRCW